MDTLCRQVVENCGAFETYVPLTQRILTRTQNKDNRLLATGSHEVSIQALASKMSRRAATRNRQAAARFPTPESIRTLNTEALQLHLNRYNLATTGKRQELVERLLQWYAASHRDTERSSQEGGSESGSEPNHTRTGHEARITVAAQMEAKLTFSSSLIYS